MRIMSEVFVKKAVIKWLYRHSWGLNLEVGELHEKGVDIRVRHNKYHRYFFIETKGEGKIRQADEVAFVYSLGQIITRMKVGRAGYYYGLGLPTVSAKIAIRRIPWQVSKKLLLYIFSVDRSGKVKRYSWKEIKKMQLSGK